MHGKSKEKEGSMLMGMPATDAIEILLFVIFLAGVLGAIFRERFVYVVFVAIIVLLIYEGHQRRKERKIIEKKFDIVLTEKRRQAGL